MNEIQSKILDKAFAGKWITFEDVRAFGEEDEMKMARKECLKCCLRKRKDEMKRAFKKNPYASWGFLPEGCIYSLKEIIKIWDEDDKKRKVKRKG